MRDLKSLTANIIAGYVANAKIEADQLPNLIASVSNVLDGLGKADTSSNTVVSVTKVTPARARKSITDAGIVSFEDGKTYKTLKRHLGLRGLTPESYRAKWGLPMDFPMVAPAYSAARSALAFKIGLGNKGRGAPVPVAVKPEASRGPGRPRKAASAEPAPPPTPAAPSTAVAAPKSPRKPRPPKAIDPADDVFS